MSTESTPAVRRFDPARIKFRHAIVVQGGIHTEEKFFKNPVQPVHTNATVGATFGFNSAERSVRIAVRSTFVGLDRDNQMVGIEGTYELHFLMTVDGFDEFISKAPDGTELFNHQIAVVMAGVAYSTARGIILERTLGTIMGGVFLPVVDSSGLIPMPEDAPSTPQTQKTPAKRAKKK